MVEVGGQGRRLRITQAERSRIIGLVKQPPPGRMAVQADGELVAADESGPSEGALDALAAEDQRLSIGVGRGQVRRALPAEGLRWWRTRSWICSRDPDFEGKGPGSSSAAPARRRA